MIRYIFTVTNYSRNLGSTVIQTYQMLYLHVNMLNIYFTGKVYNLSKITDDMI